MLLGAVLWFLLGLGYNAATNREAFVWNWLPRPDGSSIETKKLEDYSRIGDISILIGLAVGLGVSLSSAKRNHADKLA